MKFLAWTLLILGLLAGAAAWGMKARYGGGADFPNAYPSMPALLDDRALEVVADLPTPPGNIAVSADGRVFVTLHPEARPQFKVVELKNSTMQPFPNEAFQTGAQESRWFRDVISLRIDRQNRLWTLDNGGHGVHPGRLLAFDVNDGAVLHEYEFPRELAGLGSHLNDFQVSADGNTIYIAEASFFGQTPALIVYDVRNQHARRLLENHASVVAENFTPVVQGRRMTAFGLVDIRPGVDSIVLDPAGEWLYYAAVTAQQMYRVRTTDLLDASLSPEQLAARVEVFAKKTMSDGLTVDTAGNIYVSDLEHDAILLMRTDGSLQPLLQSPRLRWPDGFSFGPDGWLYVSCSALHQIIGQLPSSVTQHAPYQVFRLRPGYEGVPGH